jgi:hypothetical protein
MQIEDTAGVMPAGIVARDKGDKQRVVNGVFTLTDSVILMLTLLARPIMIGRTSLSRLLFLLATLPVAGAASAAPVAPVQNATGSVKFIHPVSITNIASLDFGNVTAVSAGTIVINPNTMAVTTTGGVTSAGGNPHAATFLGAAQSSAVVNIRIPKQPITLTRAGGTETMTVSNWQLQGQDKRTLAAQSSFEFRVGATLTVGANQAEGTYTGTFSVEIQYP